MGIKIAGLKAIMEKVSLSGFFDGDVWVVIKPLSSPVKALIQEKSTSGVTYNTDRRGQTSSMQKDFKAEDIDSIMQLKLLKGVIEHNITNESGEPAKWDEETIAAIDAVCPAVLDFIAERVTKLSYPPATEEDEKEGGNDLHPTSRGKKSKK